MLNVRYCPAHANPARRGPGRRRKEPHGQECVEVTQSLRAMINIVRRSSNVGDWVGIEELLPATNDALFGIRGAPLRVASPTLARRGQPFASPDVRISRTRSRPSLGTHPDLRTCCLQEGGRLLTDNDAGRHRIARRHARQNGRIRDAQAVDAVDLQPAIDNRHGIAAHFCCAALVPEGAKTVAKEAFEFTGVAGSRCNLAYSERSQGSRVADAASNAESGHQVLQFVWITEVVGLYSNWIVCTESCQVDGTTAFGPHAKNQGPRVCRRVEARGVL